MKLPEPGDVVAQRYQLQSLLGEGGFAVVYRAHDMAQNRGVAVKLLKPQEQKYSTSRLAQFERELGALVRLNSPNTVQVLDHGQEPSGILFLVFEFVPGEDLNVLVHRGALSADVTRHILLQVLNSLQEAHAAGVLHRDIKPGNIRVFQNGTDPYYAKLLDFGVAKPLAKQAPSVTKTGHMVGTLKYASPEQLFGWDMTPSSDLYSLGIVAYEMLVGRVPDHMRSYGTRKPIQLPDHVTDEGLRYVVERLLEHETSRRFTSAAQVSRALIEGPGRADRAVETVDESQRNDTSRQSTILGIAAGVGVVVILAVVFLATRDSSPPPPTPMISPVNRAALMAGSSKPEPTPLVREESVEEVTDVEEVADMDTGLAPRPEGPLPRGCGIAPPLVGSGQLAARDGREYNIVIPHNYDPHKQYSALVTFHEVGEMPGDFLRYSGFTEYADELEYIIIGPGGSYLDPWKGSFDKHLLSIESAMDKLCIDPNRIYAVGNGAGGLAVERLPCHMQVRAIANSGFRNTEESQTRCHRKESTPFIYFAHSKDGYEPLRGGDGCYGDRRISLKAKEKIWKRYNQCRGAETVYYKYKGTVCSTWSCEEPFISCVVNGGRRWPGTNPRVWDVRNCDGPVPNFDYIKTIWQFFEEQTPEGVAPRRLVDLVSPEAPPESPPQ